MQFKISDEAAIVTADEFYTALAAGYPVDASLTLKGFVILSRTG